MIFAVAVVGRIIVWNSFCKDINFRYFHPEFDCIKNKYFNFCQILHQYRFLILTLYFHSEYIFLNYISWQNFKDATQFHWNSWNNTNTRFQGLNYTSNNYGKVVKYYEIQRTEHYFREKTLITSQILWELHYGHILWLEGEEPRQRNKKTYKIMHLLMW